MAVLAPKQGRMKRRVTFSYLTIFFFVVGSVGFGLFLYEGLYQQQRVDGIAQVARFLPLPIARLDGKVIYYGQVMAYQDVSPGFDEALEHVVNQTYIQLLAEELDAEVTGSEVNEYMNREGMQALLDEIDWSRRQYERRIVEPLLLAQKVEQIVYSSEKYQEEPRDAIDRIARDLELGILFTDLAFIYSEDYSASTGGYLDYYMADDALMQVVPVFDLDLLTPSDVIEMETAFTIAQLYDVVEVEEERMRVGVQWILIRKQGLASAIELKREELPVQYFIQWD